jgi:hypothetical protein
MVIGNIAQQKQRGLVFFGVQIKDLTGSFLFFVSVFDDCLDFFLSTVLLFPQQINPTRKPFGCSRSQIASCGTYDRSFCVAYSPSLFIGFTSGFSTYCQPSFSQLYLFNL